MDATYNVGVLGQLLYTFYSHLFILAGLILLLSLVGSIALTLDQKVNVDFFRRQDLFAQVDCQESGLFLWLVASEAAAPHCWERIYKGAG